MNIHRRHRTEVKATSAADPLQADVSDYSSSANSFLMISSAGTTDSPSGRSGMATAPTIWTIVSLLNGTGLISLTTS